jgi:hypothetical protein
LAGFHDLPPSSVRKMPADEMPMYMRFAFFGSSWIEWRQRPPAPGVQFLRDGCFESP